MKPAYNKPAAAAAALFLFCSPAASQAGSEDRHRFDPEEFAERAVERIDDRLDLSDVQEDELQELIEQAAEKIDRQRRQIAETAAAAFAEESFSEQDAQEMLDSMEGARKMRRQIMVQTLVGLHQLLSPEQRAEAGRMLANRSGLLFGSSLSGRRGDRDDDDHDHRRRYRR